MKKYIIENGVLVKYKGKAAQPIIPKDVIAIGKNAFQYRHTLKRIKIPDGITSIGFCAFNCCTKLTSIKLPNSVTHIGDNAFCGCENLLSVDIPNNVKNIGWGTFEGCYELTSIKLPNSVTEIDAHAFNGCSCLASINIPKNVTYIGVCAFSGIKKVKPQYNDNGTLRAFKAFHEDWACYGGFKYEVGKSYHLDGKISCCSNGFHACTNPLSVFNHYYGCLADLHLHFAEVELSGTISFGDIGDKVAASDITIVRELTASELAEIYSNMEKC